MNVNRLGGVAERLVRSATAAPAANEQDARRRRSLYALRELTLRERAAASSCRRSVRRIRVPPASAALPATTCPSKGLARQVEADHDRANPSNIAPKTPISALNVGSVATLRAQHHRQREHDDLDLVRCAREPAGRWAISARLCRRRRRARQREHRGSLFRHRKSTKSALNPSRLRRRRRACRSRYWYRRQEWRWMVGFSVGGGLDVALTRYVSACLYEHVQFAPIANLVVDVNSVRGGLGVKF